MKKIMLKNLKHTEVSQVDPLWNHLFMFIFTKVKLLTSFNQYHELGAEMLRGVEISPVQNAPQIRTNDHTSKLF